MAAEYCYAQGAAEFGPFSAGQLRELAAAGRITGTDLVWRYGTTARCRASRVEHLFPPGTAVVPPVEDVPGAPPVVAEPTVEPAAAVEPAIEPAAPPPPAGFVGGRPPEKVRPKRVTGITGGLLVGQDGHSVKFLKKCEKCKYEDRNRTTAVIRAGSTRVPFFCPKCRRGRQVVITGVG